VLDFNRFFSWLLYWLIQNYCFEVWEW